MLRHFDGLDLALPVGPEGGPAFGPHLGWDLQRGSEDRVLEVDSVLLFFVFYGPPDALVDVNGGGVEGCCYPDL